jgi:hypothetical protein
MRWAIAFCVMGCGTTVAVDAGEAGTDATSDAPQTADWVLDLDGAQTAGRLNPALLGQYDLSGALFSYDKVPGLPAAMTKAGLTEWRIGAGRWELITQLLPSLTDGTSCAAETAFAPPEAFAPNGATDLNLIAARDWFTDDGLVVDLAATDDDGRYALAYARSVIDVAASFDAKPYFDIDLMPRALAAGTKLPDRSKTTIPDACVATFTNKVSNVKPENPQVFAAAATGMIRRIVEGSNGQKGRALPYVEVWNEPDAGNYFWDKNVGTFPEWISMAAFTIVRLDAYRKASANPDAKAMRIGLGGFAAASVAAAIVSNFDAAPIPFDFVSFHSYQDDPLAIVADIQTVAAARKASKSYGAIELVLSEWGPALSKSTLDPKTMDPALHLATVIALGAAAGLDHAHHSFFWDFYSVVSMVPFGLLDHQVQPKPAYHAYAMLARLVGGDRLVIAGREDGRFDGGMGAVLASRDANGRSKVLVVNRGNSAKTVSAGLAAAVTILDDPAKPPHTLAPATIVTVPPRSIVLIER